MNTSTFLCQLLIVAIANLITNLISNLNGKDNGGHKFITIKIEPLSGEPKFHLGSGFWISVWIVILLAVEFLLIETAK